MIKLIAITLLCLIICEDNVLAQKKIIAGIVKDSHSEEWLPYASIGFKNTSIGKSTDSAGRFSFSFNKWPSDTVIITSISYKPFIFIIPKNKDSISITAALQAATAEVEVVLKLKQKHSRGWYLWKKIVAHKDSNNIFKNDNFSYRIYNKMELDINNIKQEKLKKNRLLKPLGIILNNIDSLSEEKPILPGFFSETISDYQFQKRPRKTHETIIASKMSGYKDEGLLKYLGGLYANIVVYDNFIPVFDKKFISPINDNGDAYYDYRLADTQRLAGSKLLHLIFIPKHPGENTFTGDCWVHDTTFAIQKIIMHADKDANINYVDKLSLVQEFKLIDDSTWFLSKDKFVVNLNPIGKKKAGVIARKTTFYNDIRINTEEVTLSIKKNKKAEQVDIAPNVSDKPDFYWDSARILPLAKNEKMIYVMVDSLLKLPAYNRYYNAIYFLTTGYKNIGNFRIGPWFSWVTGNQLEGTRLRFDFSTNKEFDPNIYVHTYLAYGFKDKIFKGGAEALWVTNRKTWQQIHVAWFSDLDFSQNYSNGIGNSNFLSVAIRKQGIPFKFIKLDEKKVEFFTDSKMGLSANIKLTNKTYTPLKGLPDKADFTMQNNPFTTSEVSIKFRFAYLEKFYETNFYRYSLGSPYPEVDAGFTQGIKGFLKSRYSYQKLEGSINQQIGIATFGSVEYHIYGGKIFGTLPYMLLEVHPGNEVYYYNRYAFNLMNRFEYISDSYAGISFEHSLGNGFFRFIPITRKLKIRQFWNIKAITGNLGVNNKALNFTGNHTFKSLDNNTYVEVGTGIDNIFKLLRIDFVWRLLPKPLPGEEKVYRFGVFGSIKFQL